jgi:CHAD domain-containing protein
MQISKTGLHKTGTFNAQSLTKILPKGFSLSMLDEQVFRGSTKDTFERHLLRTGKILLQANENLKLIDLQTGTFDEQAVSRDWNFSTDLKGGPIGFQCLELTRLRAFTAGADLEVKIAKWAVRDELEKTVVRLRAITLFPGSKKSTWVSMEPLRGYAEEAAMVFQCLEKSGYERVGKKTVPGIGNQKEIYTSKPYVPISAEQPILESANLIVRTFLDVARKNESGILNDIDTEFLHDFRVSLRRVRSLLSLFRGVYPDAKNETWRSQLAAIMKQTNRLRDLDVYLMDRESYYKLVPESMYAGLNCMFDIFRQERNAALDSVCAGLNEAEYKKNIAALKADFRSSTTISGGKSAQEPTKHFANRLILKRYKKIAAIAESINHETPDETVHALRIQCKKLRYLMEFFAVLYPAKIKPLIKSLKGLQDVLGRFNDYSVQRESLSTFVETHRIRGRKGRQLAESVGALVATLYQLQIKARDEVEQHISDFVNKRTRSDFIKLCSHTG